MNRALKLALAILLPLLLAYGAFAAFASYSNGSDVHVTLEVGTDRGGMYLRCVSIDGPGASCTKDNQTTITVHERDRLHVTLMNRDGGDHTHDFTVEGWQYFLWPASPEMELEETKEEVTITAWAPGTYAMVCELPHHAELGMKGTLVVKAA